MDIFDKLEKTAYKEETNQQIYVLGAGIGGLVCACLLAKKGYKVTVIEQSREVGGKAGKIYLESSKGRFYFDSGPSLITLPKVFTSIFSLLGKSFEQTVPITELETSCKYFFSQKNWNLDFSDNSKQNSFYSIRIKKNGVIESTDINQKELSTIQKKLDYFYNYSEKIYKLTADLFLYSDFGFKTLTKLKFWKAFLSIFSIDPLRTMNQANQKILNYQTITQIFNRYATYNGSSPYLTPATLNIIASSEKNFGTWAPLGQIYDIPESLYKIAIELGVKFEFNQKIQNIITLQNKSKMFGLSKNKIKKIKSTNKVWKFGDNDKLVVNFDPVLFYKNLDNLNSKQYKYIQKLEKTRKNTASTSAIVFYLGVDISKANLNLENLEVHNIFFSENYKTEFKELLENKLPTDPTIYLHISSKINPKHAPDNCQNWFLMINLPAGYNFDKDSIKKLEKYIFLKLNQALNINLEQMIVAKEIRTPKDFANLTGSFLGSLYGRSSNSKISAFLRDKRISPILENCYFVGGSGHPGGGMPLVSLSGALTADLIISLVQ